MIPKDPMILLSYVNTQLRDYYESLEALCTCRGLNRQKLLEKMDSIDYHYDEKSKPVHLKKLIAIFALFLAAFTWGSAFCVLKDTLKTSHRSGFWPFVFCWRVSL